MVVVGRQKICVIYRMKSWLLTFGGGGEGWMDRNPKHGWDCYLACRVVNINWHAEIDVADGATARRNPRVGVSDMRFNHWPAECVYEW